MVILLFTRSYETVPLQIVSLCACIKRPVKVPEFSIEKSASFATASISVENLDWSSDCTATSVESSFLELLFSFLQAEKMATKKNVVAKKRTILVFIFVERFLLKA